MGHQQKNYTLTINVNLKYRAKPASKANLDVEGTTGVPDAGYVVYPVTKNVDGTYFILPEGTITNIYGNTAFINTVFPELKNWTVRSLVVVYKKQSCEKAFPHHNPYKFQWQDGIKNALWPTSKIIADKSITLHGRVSGIMQINGNNNLPIHIESDDCVAHSFINDSDREQYPSRISE